MAAAGPKQKGTMRRAVLILVSIVGLASAAPQARAQGISSHERLAVTPLKENGKTVYEVETLVNGKTRDLLFAADGALLLVEEESSLEAIPAAAKAAIERLAAGGRITTIELVKKGAVTTYEAIVVKKGKKSEIVVDRDGTVTR